MKKDIIFSNVEVTITSDAFLFYTLKGKDMTSYIPEAHKVDFPVFDFVTGAVKFIPFPEECAHLGDEFRLACVSEYNARMADEMEGLRFVIDADLMKDKRFAKEIECINARIETAKAFFRTGKRVDNVLVHAVTATIAKLPLELPDDQAYAEDRVITAINTVKNTIANESGVSTALKAVRKELTDYARTLWTPSTELSIDDYVVNVNATSTAHVWARLFPSAKISKDGKVTYPDVKRDEFTYELIKAILNQLQTAKANEGKLNTK